MIVEDTGWGHLHVRFAEWQNGIAMTLWGLYLLLHPTIFADSPITPQWSGMLILAPQEVWGICALAGGTLRLGALYINGRHRRTPTIRLITSFISLFILTQIILGMSRSGVATPSLIIYPMLLLADVYSVYRASADMTFVAQAHKTELARGGSTK